MPISSPLRIRASTSKTSQPLIHRRWKGRSAYWTAEKLKTSPKYPLSKELYQKVGYGLGKGVSLARSGYTKGRMYFTRPQIVSPDLCDDVLSYTGPTLEKHKGCDILDLNPGAGLWSSKIHEYLQPRTHLLVEPSPDLYSQFLQPLLDQPGSTYKMLAQDPCEYDLLHSVLDEYFPRQKQQAASGSPLRELNTSLLITGSLLWEPMLPGLGFTSMSRQMIAHYNQWAWKRKWVHAFGPVRMLLWLQNDEFKAVLPKTIPAISKYDFFLRRVSNIKEVVTPPHEERSVKGSSTAISRNPTYELESLVKALKRGEENGFELPGHRRDNVHGFVSDVMRISEGTGIINATQTSILLKEAEKSGRSTLGLLPENTRTVYQWDGVLEKNPDYFVDYKKMEQMRLSNLKTTSKRVTAEGKVVTRARASANSEEQKKINREPLVNMGENIYLLECKILGMVDGKEKEIALEELKKQTGKFEQDLKSCDVASITIIDTEIDDRICLRHSDKVRRLLWDDRPFEPLVMQPEEVWPANRITLADIEPLPIPEHMEEERPDEFDDFVHGIFASNYVLPLPQALERLEHGASELIDMVPALRDPTKGGRLNMDFFRVRMLTPEMVEGLVQAFRDWPFRPPAANQPRYFQLKTERVAAPRSKYQ